VDTGFNKPNGVAVDAKDNIYVVDRANSRVQKLSPSGVILARWGMLGSGSGQFSLASNGRLNGIAVGRHGNVFVADTANNRIQKLSPQGKVLSVWR
jgi:sugar lactone lactonase YvrE